MTDRLDKVESIALVNLSTVKLHVQPDMANLANDEGLHLLSICNEMYLSNYVE